MARPRIAPHEASANSAATNHQKAGGNGCPAKCPWIASRIFFETARTANGNNAAVRREHRPPKTTAGPDSQTIRTSWGTFCSAWKRVRQLSQNVCGLSAIQIQLFG